jgi:hypothetical protein
MPTLDTVRSTQAQFRAQCEKLVLRGTGDPDPSAGILNSVYLDESTTPVTVWVKRRTGWEKARPGATE